MNSSKKTNPQDTMTTQILSMTPKQIKIELRNRTGVSTGQKTFKTNSMSWILINDILGYIHAPEDAKAIVVFYAKGFSKDQLAKLRQGYFPTLQDKKNATVRKKRFEKWLEDNDAAIQQLEDFYSSQPGFMGGNKVSRREAQETLGEVAALYGM